MTLSAEALAPVNVPTPKWWPLVGLLLTLLALWPAVLTFLPGMLHLPKYEVSGGQIVAHSLASRTVIPAGTPVEKVQLQFARRDFGSSMAGYQVGRFSTDRGRIEAYGNGSGAGLLFGTRPPTFLTPADPDTLLDAWRSGRTATFYPAPVSTTENMVFLLLMLPSAGVVAALFLKKPQITYTLSGDALTVKTQGSTTQFPRAETKARLTQERLGMKLFGSNMPGYYTGTYATKLGNVQAAATTSRPQQALLLERDGKRYYLTPSDPQAVADWFGGVKG